MSVVEDANRLVNLVKDDEIVLNKHVDRLSWGVVKFISPENVIEKKTLFDLNQFLYHDVNKQLVDMCHNIVININNEFNNKVEACISKLKNSKSGSDHELADLLKETISNLFLNEEVQNAKILRQYRLDQSELQDRFETYKLENRQSLENEFSQQVTKQTCVRGLKLSGAFETLGEARERAKHVNKIEPHINAYAVPLNVWIPWDPNPDAIQDQEYMLDELNDMMGKYKESAEAKNEMFEKRKKAMIDKAKQENNATLKERLKHRKLESAQN